MATTEEIRQQLREFAMKLISEQSPREGQPGVPLFTLLEDAAVAIGDAFTEELIEQELSRHCEHGCDCPQCGQRGLRKGERERSVQTRRGKVKFTEPELYCPRCRRAFFPSIGSDGSGRGLRLQPERVAEDRLLEHEGT